MTEATTDTYNFQIININIINVDSEGELSIQGVSEKKWVSIQSVIFVSIQEKQQHQIYLWVGNCEVYLHVQFQHKALIN